MAKRAAAPGAAAILCRPDGGVIEVLHDDLGLGPFLPPGSFLTAAIQVHHVAQAARFLRDIRERSFAEGYLMAVALPGKTPPLHFLGYRVENGVVVVAAEAPLPRGALFQTLAEVAGPGRDNGQGSRCDVSVPIAAHRTAVGTAAAHRLLNRLNGITAASEFLLDDAGPSLASEQKMLLQSIHSSGRAMFRMIHDLLDLVAVETGNLRLEPRVTDIVALVKQTSLSNRDSAERKRVRLELAPANRLPPVTVDRARISRMVDSLLTNSIEASIPGGRVQIRVEIQNQCAVVTTHVEHSMLSVDGARMLFRPYDEPQRKPARARDLAARVAERIPEETDGSLHVDGAPGAGLTFTVELPIAAAEAYRRES